MSMRRLGELDLVLVARRRGGPRWTHGCWTCFLLVQIISRIVVGVEVSVPGSIANYVGFAMLIGNTVCNALRAGLVA